MNICSGICLFLPFLLCVTLSKPLDSLLDANDAVTIDSNIYKVYAPVPIDDLQVAGTGAKKHEQSDDFEKGEDENNGYYTSKSTKGDNGYKQFDSFHKKGGDNYGFEKHTAYGKGTGGKKGGSHHSSSSYHSADGDEKGSKSESFAGEGTELKNSKAKNKKGGKDHKTAATDGEYYFSNYEGEGEGGSEHIEGDEGHYEEGDGGYFSEHYEEGGGEGGDSEGYYEGEGESDSESYYDGEGESRQKSVVHHGKPTKPATSYSVRHY